MKIKLPNGKTVEARKLREGEIILPTDINSDGMHPLLLVGDQQGASYRQLLRPIRPKKREEKAIKPVKCYAFATGGRICSIHLSKPGQFDKDTYEIMIGTFTPINRKSK
jgi:hypothetical protein